MKYLLTLFLLVSGITDPVTKIAKSNKLKRQAKEAFDNANYEKAVNDYLLLFDSLNSEDEVAKMNLANAAYLLSYGGDNIGLMKDISSGEKQVQDSAALSEISGQLRYFDIAEANYSDLKDAQEPTLASSAYNQMGVISYKMSEQSPDERESFMQTSLSNFKNALKKNPQNESARYNYELLKKLKKQQEEEQEKKDEENKDQDKKEDQEKKDQEKQDQENKDKQDQEKKEDQEKDQEKKDEENQDQENQENQEPSEDEKSQEEDPMQKIKDKLEEMNISPEKAEMILEAMKNNEKQYVQQNKRKATKRKDSNKPDW
jgi:hypothetical protein